MNIKTILPYHMLSIIGIKKDYNIQMNDYLDYPLKIKYFLIKNKTRDLPGSPVVKTLPLNAQGVSSIPARGCKISYASQPKKKNKKRIPKHKAEPIL